MSPFCEAKQSKIFWSSSSLILAALTWIHSSPGWFYLNRNAQNCTRNLSHTLYNGLTLFQIKLHIHTYKSIVLQGPLCMPWMLSLRGWYWDQWCLVSLLVTWAGRSSAPPGKVAHDTQLCGAVGPLEGRDAIQRDVGLCEPFSEAKCKVLHMGKGNCNHQHSLWREQTESPHEEKNLGSIGWQEAQRLALAAQKANCELGCIKSSVPCSSYWCLTYS